MAKSAATQLQWNDSLWQHKIRKMARKLKVDEKPLIKKQSSFLLRDIARYVPPYSKFPRLKSKSMGTKADQRQGQNAVKKDLSLIFFVPDDPKVYNWARDTFNPGQPIYSGKKIVGASVARTFNDLKMHHTRQQNRRGRVKVLKGPLRVWASKTLFNVYHKHVASNIGIAKASVAKAALQLNRSIKVPVWIKRQFQRASGQGRLIQRRSGPVAIFKCRAAGLQHVQLKTLKILKRMRLQDMERQLKKLLKSNARVAGFRTH